MKKDKNTTFVSKSRFKRSQLLEKLSKNILKFRILDYLIGLFSEKSKKYYLTNSK